MEIKNIKGQRFGRLIVGTISHKNNHGSWCWNCKCDCGNLCIISGASLRSGRTQSCGCYNKERSSATHLQHGVAYTNLAAVRNTMLQRCYSPNSKSYPDYGGRGISVCEAWKIDPVSFYDWAFSSGYKEGLSLDRINNEGNYEPSNCKWSTRKEQNNNQRSNHLITYKGITKNLAQWSEETGLSRSTIEGRLKRGWTEEETFTLPANTKLNAWRKKNETIV